MRCRSLPSSEEINSQSSKRTNCVGHITYIGSCTKWEEDSNYKVIFFSKVPNIILGMPGNILSFLKCTWVDIVLNSTVSRQS